ncbi:MAG: 3-isopropylmalate dehydrogenase [Desulfitobacteriaceae bacterium]|nr:3-isopropylmalate dehydrogenase [Desulfitobacteriaceae bacterium]
MNRYRIAVLPGDGIGQEIIPQAVKVLKKVGEKYDLEFNFTEAPVGGAAIDIAGVPLPEDTMKLCQESEAILLGAIGGPKWDQLPTHIRPEAAALLPLRKRLGLYANIRPVALYPELVAASTLKEEVIAGTDMVVIRELTGGLYFGEKRREKTETGELALDTLIYTTEEIERIVRLAFETAKGRRNKVTSVDKANVLESGRLWRETVMKIAPDYPEVELDHMYVDNCAMQLVRSPKQFDVIVTENTFGDILTDQASMISGSIGMLASASIGGKVGLYEPSHGSAPDIAGQNKANPLATILSGAMMLEYSFHRLEAAQEIKEAVAKVLKKGYRTADLAEAGKKILGTEEMGNLVADEIR